MIIFCSLHAYLVKSFVSVNFNKSHVLRCNKQNSLYIRIG